ncbi:FAD-dependent oxidoreductase [Enteroscipio rubneri]|uniref:FAD-binding dehydrogenase n=1 Tax=Enteroscipio rubneri TaxID=2070686 RepID=A0A2K2UC02_9ACTN|nr:FAD-binding protein [Enteroscipio rubneri]PNV67728.1 FAD-binding dehydrogenase [Enteroscipio rubneri]
MGDEFKNKTTVSRRGFLSGAAVLGAGAALAGLAGCAGGQEAKPSAGNEPAQGEEPTAKSDITIEKYWEVAPDPISDDQISETIDCDIVVCGAGIAGLPGAAFAAEQGANVHVLEKAGTWGTARLCTCGFNAKCQVDNDITYDRDKFITDVWKITNGSQGRMSSYGKWFDNSAPYIDWLQTVFQSKGYDIVPQQVTGFKVTNDGVGQVGANEFWATYAAMIYFVDKDGKTLADGVNIDWTGILAEYAADNGATFHYNTPAVQLVRDESGRAISVIGENESGEYVKLNASKGILLACGDMGGDREMMGYFNPSLLKTRSIAEVKNTGDGQKMGMWIGADMDDFAAGDLFPFVAVDTNGERPEAKDSKSYAAVANLPVFMVDTTGRRLMPEDLPFQACSIPKITATADGSAWSVWDSAWQAKFPESYPKGDYLSMNTPEQLEIDIKNGITVQADTLEELVEQMGVDPEIFNEQLERYHGFCAAGKDLDFYKNPLWLTTIDTPPFYASRHVVSITSTRGGLRNDEHCRVLDKEGMPIPGLYAAGNTAGSFYGNVYPPNIMGSGIGHGQCFSWISAKDMLGIEYI